ncbi:MAG: anaerobic carbon-monoxide dehydrogenase iron sulfur subunit [Clostridia bacterium]|jgi:Fe-S-cluster-containing hydrogenase component 2|nr:anaerobic carbon-monoxide dehydrogenase iron sulfur subunit [Clostridia bacterium]
MKKILVDKQKCSGCKICESVCSYQKLGDRFNRRKAAIRVIIEGDLGEKITPVVCRHCKKAKCAEVCPEDAFYHDNKTGALVINENKCIGCGLCAEACPFGAIYLHSDFNIPLKCDLCGGNPQCIKYCVPQAIIYEEENRVGSLKRERGAK